jgi:hypothetical protein
MPDAADVPRLRIASIYKTARAMSPRRSPARACGHATCSSSPAGRSIRMTVYDYVIATHRRILALLDELERASATSRPVRGALFSMLEEALLAHAETEQEVFYRTLLHTAADPGGVARAFDAHTAILGSLVALQVLPLQDRRWNGELRALRSLFESHVRDEEGALFEQARAQLTRWEEVVIAECMRSEDPDWDELCAADEAGEPADLAAAPRTPLRLVH